MTTVIVALTARTDCIVEIVLIGLSSLFVRSKRINLKNALMIMSVKTINFVGTLIKTTK